MAIDSKAKKRILILYLSKLPRFEKKVRVALDWMLDLLFSKDLVQFMELTPPVISRVEERTTIEITRDGTEKAEAA